jgi:hypothetical protein
MPVPMPMPMPMPMNSSSERQPGNQAREEAENQTKATSKNQKRKAKLDADPIPPHWHPPNPVGKFGRLWWTLFNILCVTSFGHAGLQPVWASMKLEQEGDDSVWDYGVRQTCDRLNNMLLVVRLNNLEKVSIHLIHIQASLLLATSAAFVTTDPPRASIVNYTMRGPYICLLGAFGLLIGGIVVASVAVLVISKIDTRWAEKVCLAFCAQCSLLKYDRCYMPTASTCGAR